MEKSIAALPFRRRLFGYWLVAPLIQLCFLLLIAQPADRTAWQVQFSFLAITAFSSACLFTDIRPASLYQIWWLFYIVFMGMVPAVHFDMGVMPWRSGDISPGTQLTVNLLVLLCLLSFAAVYAGAFRVLRRRPRALLTDDPAAPSTFRGAYGRLAVPIMLLCGLGVVLLQGLPGLFLRGHAEEALQRFHPTFLLLADKVLRGAMLLLSLLAIHLARHRQISRLQLFAMLGLALLFNFPLSMPRYLVAAFFPGWIIAQRSLLVRFPHLLKTALLVAILALAPLANVVRYTVHPPAHVRMDTFADYYRVSFLLADFDPYASLCRTWRFVGEHGHTSGKQALGVAGFFVPRKAWPGKPFGSGYTVYQDQGFAFLNVACTFLAEGLINFGIIGMIGFSLAAALLLALYDERCGFGGRSVFSFPLLFYPAAPGLLLFILRGDLLSSFAYTAGLAVSGWAVFQLLRLVSPRPRAGSIPLS